MLWIVVIASTLGFLAVEWVANYPTVANLLEQGFSQHTTVNFILISLILLLLIIWFFIKKQQTIIDNQLTGFDIFIKKLPNFLLVISLFFLTVLASLSTGLYHYQSYQKTLLNQPLNITATIKVNQLSDSVSHLITINQQKNLLGTAYPRQIWQIIDINEFSGIKTVEQKLQNMQVLASFDVLQNPENLQIINQLQPNDTLKVQLALRPIAPKTATLDKLPNSAKIVDIGFDEKRWLRQQNVQALANVVEFDKNSLQKNHYGNRGSFLIKIEQLRWYFREKIQQNMFKNFEQKDSEQIVKIHDSHAILLGLLTGDRALMSSHIKNIYQQTGISHLLAISGPHVLMLASILSLWALAFVKCFLPNLLIKIPSNLLVLWVSVVVAGLYALFVGFELPAQRTFWLLLMMTLASQFLVAQRAFASLAVVGLIMMWWDTTAVLQAGFWLSFVAVFLLMQFSQKVGQNDMVEIFEKSNGYQLETPFLQRIILRLSQEFMLLAKLQLWLFVCMMPIVIWFFGKISLIGLLVNLFAVPFLGLVIVPLDMLAGVLTLLSFNGLGSFIWNILHHLLIIFHQFLLFLSQNKLANPIFISLSQSQLIFCILLAVVYFSRGILSKFLMLPMILAMVFIHIKNTDISKNKLIVMDNHRINMQLLLANGESWLILSDNQFVKKPKKNQLVIENITQQNWQENLLYQQIFPILAKYKVDNLTGIISQTPTESTNQLAQTLAKNFTVRQYFLAGFDAIKPLKNPQNQNFSYPNLTPQSCQAGQVFLDNQAVKLQALTGWQLTLSNQQISDSERVALMPCFLSLNDKKSEQKQIIITAGNQTLPMQMLKTMYPNLCVSHNIDLLISPYQLSYDKDWLMSLNPAHLHVITGSYDNQKLSERNAFSLLALTHSPKIVQSDSVGVVEYWLQ